MKKPWYNHCLASLLFIIGMHSSLRAQTLDYTIAKDFNNINSSFAKNTTNIISKSTYAISGGIATYWLVKSYIQKDSIQYLHAVSHASALLVTSGIVFLLKNVVQRNRPFSTHTDIENLGQEDSPNNSFPSGHSSIAFSTATALSIAIPKWYVIAGAYTWASAVAVSRIEQGAHYPSDVVVGALIGSASAWLCHRANQWLHRHSAR